MSLKKIHDYSNAWRSAVRVSLYSLRGPLTGGRKDTRLWWWRQQRWTRWPHNRNRNRDDLMTHSDKRGEGAGCQISPCDCKQGVEEVFLGRRLFCTFFKKKKSHTNHNDKERVDTNYDYIVERIANWHSRKHTQTFKKDCYNCGHTGESLSAWGGSTLEEMAGRNDEESPVS